MRAAFETLEKALRGNKVAKKDGGVPSLAVEDLCAIPKYALSDKQGGYAQRASRMW